LPTLRGTRSSTASDATGAAERVDRVSLFADAGPSCVRRRSGARTGSVVKLYTIGFTRTTAEEFFAKLRGAGIVRVIDARIRRDGQLSGFAKMPDFEYFLTKLTSSVYQQSPSLRPTPELLKSYRDKALSWDQYAEAYRNLLRERRPEREYARASSITPACFVKNTRPIDATAGWRRNICKKCRPGVST
jgi:uncharacterized protein YeaO (DUF488 family)